MRPRFQADADFNHKIVLGLRRREPSVNFLSARDGGVAGVPDSDVLRIAAESGRILVSHDRNTMPAHFADFLDLRSSPGFVIVSRDLDIGAAPGAAAAGGGSGIGVEGGIDGGQTIVLGGLPYTPAEQR